MGNNNVIAGLKKEDNTKVDDQQISDLEEINGIDLKADNRNVSEHEIKDFHERIEGSSSENICGSEDLRAEKRMLNITEDIETQIRVPEENGEAPSEKIQESVETEAAKNPSDDVEMLGDESLEMLETFMEEDENKEIENQIEISKANGESPSKEIQELVETQALKNNSDDDEIFGNKNLEMIETILENEDNKDFEAQIEVPEESGEPWSEKIQEFVELEAAAKISDDVVILGDKKLETIETKEIQDLVETQTLKNNSDDGEILGNKNLEMIETILENEDNKDIEAQTEVSEESGEPWSKKIQEFVEIEALEKISDDVVILGDKKLETVETMLEKEENNDDLLPYRTDEKQENGENLIHDTDRDAIESILQNEANRDNSSPIEIATKTGNMLTGNEIAYIIVGERESQIKDNNNSERIKGGGDLEEVATSIPKLQTIATDFSARIEEKRKTEKEILIPDFQRSSNSVPSSPQLNSQTKPHYLENGPNLSIYSEHDVCNELVSFKSPDYDFENKELQTLEPVIDVTKAVETNLVKVIKTETISGMLSTGSIQDKPSLYPELRKSPSFVFDLPLESKLEESDQTPLLCHNKAISRSISSPGSQPISVEEKTIQVERSDSDKLKGPSSDLFKEVGSDTFLKRDCQTSFERNALTKRSEKRKPRPSMFTTCICCAAAIS